MAHATKAKFRPAGPFHQELKDEVDAYLSTRQPRDLPAMYLKTAIILGWTVGSYLFLMFVASSVLAVVAGCISLALAMAGIGFSIQHDANHGAYSDKRWVNSLFEYTLDLEGGSSYVWKWKHNIFHHSHPNVVGLDADIDLAGLGRLAPSQKRLPGHRFQHLYMWFLYGLLPIKWHYIDDYVDLVKGTVGNQLMPRAKGVKLLKVLGGKLFFYSWALVLPLVLHPVWIVALAYFLTSFVLGLALAIAFQLAHCVEDAEFPVLPAEGERAVFEDDFAAHQLRTTVDFAPKNALVTWYLGGLNFQVVHHLFPTVCHLHYPALAKIVESVASRHGLRYRYASNARGALRSHWRWLRRMGAPSAVAEDAAPALAA